jgi:hypothetical protein
MENVARSLGGGGYFAPLLHNFRPTIVNKPSAPAQHSTASTKNSFEMLPNMRSVVLQDGTLALRLRVQILLAGLAYG